MDTSGDGLLCRCARVIQAVAAVIIRIEITKLMTIIRTKNKNNINSVI